MSLSLRSLRWWDMLSRFVNLINIFASVHNFPSYFTILVDKDVSEFLSYRQQKFWPKKELVLRYPFSFLA